MKTLCCLVICGLYSLSAMGKKFSNDLVEFDLPPGWNCQMDRGDWICQSGDASQRKEAIIVVSSKRRGPEDSVQHYQKHLKKGRSYRVADQGNSYISQPKYVKTVPIAKHLWVDALQLSGEVPGFYTRYMATVKGETGIAVTFTVARGQYAQYRALFDRMVSSLHFFEQRGEGLPLNTGVAADGELLELPPTHPRAPAQQQAPRAPSSQRVVGAVGLLGPWPWGAPSSTAAIDGERGKTLRLSHLPHLFAGLRPRRKNPTAMMGQRTTIFFTVRLELEWERIEKAEREASQNRSGKRRKKSA